MKEGWKILTFRDIIKPAKVSKAGNDCVYPVLSITMRDGIVFQNDRFKKVIASKDTSGYKVVNDGQLVIAFPIDEGLIYTQDIAEKGIMSPAYNIYDVNYLAINRVFLVKYFHSRFAMNYYKEKQRCTTQRRRVLPKEELENLPIPVPPLSEQQQIVEELDLLSGIIEKKKEQLKELDNLAQSIFYDMFGDPVANKKGWEKKKWNTLFKLKSGDGLSAKQFVPGDYPVYGGNGISGFHNAYNLEGDFIIVGRVGAYCGNVRAVNGKFWLTDNAFQLFYDKEKYNKVFLSALLNILDLHQYANAAAQPVISNSSLKEIDVMLPPIHQQVLFASKIEVIEKQKALIKQSITETETLFNSRMDYYFG